MNDRRFNRNFIRCQVTAMPNSFHFVLDHKIHCSAMHVTVYGSTLNVRFIQLLKLSECWPLG